MNESEEPSPAVEKSAFDDSDEDQEETSSFAINGPANDGPEGGKKRTLSDVMEEKASSTSASQTSSTQVTAESSTSSDTKSKEEPISEEEA